MGQLVRESMRYDMYMNTTYKPVLIGGHILLLVAEQGIGDSTPA